MPSPLTSTSLFWLFSLLQSTPYQLNGSTTHYTNKRPFYIVVMGFALILQQNKTFFVLCFLLLVLGAYPLFVFDKVTLFLQLNHCHHPVLDQFFYYVTFLGSSAMYALFMVILAVMQRDNRTLLTGVGGFVVMSAVVQGMKHIVFADQLRPIALIPTDAPMHLVAGIVPDTHLSLPSGHAATIFATACLIHFLVPKKSVWFGILVLLGAVVVAYARVYLCQHFYRDIYVGAWVGTWTITVVYGILMYWQGPAWLDQKPITSVTLLWGLKK